MPHYHAAPEHHPICFSSRPLQFALGWSCESSSPPFLSTQSTVDDPGNSLPGFELVRVASPLTLHILHFLFSSARITTFWALKGKFRYSASILSSSPSPLCWYWICFLSSELLAHFQTKLVVVSELPLSLGHGWQEKGEKHPRRRLRVSEALSFENEVILILTLISVSSSSSSKSPLYWF